MEHRFEPQPFGEVLGDEPSEPLTDRGWRWLKAHPLLLGLLVLVALVVAVPLLAWQVRGPRLPVLSVTDDGQPLTVAPWQAGSDGRPTGPVQLTVTAQVRRAGSTSATTVLGIAGPGVTRAANPATTLPAGRTTGVALRAVLDCPAVPATTPADAYRLRVRIRSGSRSRTGTVDAGTPGRRWQQMIRLACSAWTARQDVTVSTATATVNPTLPRLDVRFGLTNTGSRPVTLAMVGPASGLRVTGPLPIRVPAHGVAQAALAVDLDSCDSVNGSPDQTIPFGQDAVLSTAIDLGGLADPVPITAGVSAEPEGGGLAPTGIVLAPSARTALESALSRACGQIYPPLPMLAPNTVRYDQDTDEVTVPLLIDLAPGRVTSAALRTDPASDTDQNAYRPLWHSYARLVPDRTGQVRVVLHYRAPLSGACPDYGGYLPGFVITVRVPVPGGTRVLQYNQSLDFSSDPAAVPLLCGGAQGADNQSHSAQTRTGPATEPPPDLP